MIFEPLNFALGYCDLDELKAIYSYDIISTIDEEINKLPKNKTKSKKSSRVLNNKSNDNNFVSDSNDLLCDGSDPLNESTFNNKNCKYYSIDQFNEATPQLIKNFNLFHNNLNGLESKFDNFHQFISENNVFDFIAITETSQKTANNGFLTNIELEGFSSYSIASNSSRGGSLLYINNKHKTKVRTDLNIQNDVLEATWIEIIKVGSKSTI